MLPFLLLCLLPGASGKNCLSCWAELPALFDYDLQSLWGTPGPPAQLSQSLHSLLQEDSILLQFQYLDPDLVEEEIAKLFEQVHQAIGKFRNDKTLLLKEIQSHKDLFAERLNKRAEWLRVQACNMSCDAKYKMEITECANCRVILLSCNDPVLCPAKNHHNQKWILILTVFAIVLPVVMAGGGCYLYWLKKKETEKEQDSHLSSRNEHNPFL